MGAVEDSGSIVRRTCRVAETDAGMTSLDHDASEDDEDDGGGLSDPT